MARSLIGGDRYRLVKTHEGNASEQFAAAFDKNTWFVALKNTLEGVTAEDAVWKPEGGDNSILGDR